MISTTCEGCGGTFNVDDRWAGRRARCKRCGNVLTIPDLDIFALVDDDPLPLAGGDDDPRPAAATVAQAVAEGAPILLNHAASTQAQAEVRVAQGFATTEPRRGFWADLAYSFVFPFPSSNSIRFGFVVLFKLIYMFLGHALWYGRAGQAVITGWLWAYCFSIIQDTCAGEDDLPSFNIESGYDGIVVPIFSMLGTYLWVAWPPLLWFIVAAVRDGILPDPTADMAVLVGLIALAVLLWPMTVLTVAIFGFSLDTLRYDKQLLTIGRNFGSYVVICLMLGLTFAISIGSILLIRILSLGSGFGAAAGIGVAVLDAYSAVVTMRVIGLFYRHNKRQFAWEAE